MIGDSDRYYFIVVHKIYVYVIYYDIINSSKIETSHLDTIYIMLFEKCINVMLPIIMSNMKYDRFQLFDNLSTTNLVF